jgi:two-component system, response regulator / RNA-binding antiterminator
MLLGIGRQWRQGHFIHPSDPIIRVLIVDENPVRAALIESGLRDAGYSDVVFADTTLGLLARIRDLDPDVIVVDMANPSRDTLEQMFQVSRLVKRPITMFVDQSDSAQIRAAIDAGVSAYIVDGLKKERIKPIIDMCVMRFEAVARLENDLLSARSELEDRKIIDQAKRFVMAQKHIGEEEAYALLRRTAMNQKKRIADLARAIIAAADVIA